MRNETTTAWQRVPAPTLLDIGDAHRRVCVRRTAEGVLIQKSYPGVPGAGSAVAISREETNEVALALIRSLR